MSCKNYDHAYKMFQRLHKRDKIIFYYSNLFNIICLFFFKFIFLKNTEFFRKVGDDNTVSDEE